MTEITTISNNFVYSDTSIINPVDGINLFDGLYNPVKTYNINTSGTINITDTSSSSKWQLYIIHGTISRDIANEIPKVFEKEAKRRRKRVKERARL